MNIQTLRILSILEGISFLFLLGVAMPLKYIWDNPILMKFAGMSHGILFILFVVVLFIVCEKMKWSLSMFLTGLVAALLPFAPFWFDYKLKKMQQAQ